MTVIDFGKQPEEEKSTAVKLLTAVGLAAAIVFGGAIGWAVIGFISDSYYYIIPIAIGVGLPFVLAAPLTSLNLLKGTIVLAISVFLSVLSVAVGEFLFTVIYAYSEWGYTVGEAIYVALLNIFEVLSSVDVIIGYILGIIGVIIGLISMIRELKNKGG